ncbi:TPA: hypothetical protein RG700_001739 [Proteus mirabilis]|uniref:hypothetical protein n=1 Tax=Proteus mirabilis TaxID=584 RepID=UPI000F5B926C|nr:hypothetical protein [Proteus mirabilis]AZH06001.1 hypothetical protein EHQ78_09940 [Proteus mirabilis]ELA7950687.1 hypothetical protein [Proteus mirabilis]MBG2844561.1 hypothetical protein [Proteus mirabilis]MCW4527084.1 hypothetical protein [Proteus mirabilis]MDF7270386.1 hypothetical protein [Proteus mirabilis]
MKVEQSQVTKLVITDVERHDPIHVYLEDYGDNDANAEYAKKQVIKLRKDDEIDKHEAREYWDLIEVSDNVKDECCISFIGEKLTTLFDDALHADWPTIPNPEYIRMESRLNAVREALKQISVN